jgi:hypothetical protein
LVLLLEADEKWVSWHILISRTIGAFLSGIYLAVVRVKKDVRMLVVGSFGGFAFMNVAWYNLATSRLSRLTASYTLMVVINSIGGWFYCRGRSISVGAGSSESLFGSGHFFDALMFLGCISCLQIHIDLLDTLSSRLLVRHSAAC